MRVLVAIPCCHTYSESVDGRDKNHVRHVATPEEHAAALRETWLREFSDHHDVDYKLFYGSGGTREPLHDEVFLDVPDGYLSLPHKVQDIAAWALNKGYDHLFKADDDTAVLVDRLMTSGFERHDYVGFPQGSYSPGGPGYWLSSKSMKSLTRFPVPKYEWAEDMWVGRTLAASRIPRHGDLRYRDAGREHFYDLDRIPTGHDFISFHACTPEGLRRVHARDIPL